MNFSRHSKSARLLFTLSVTVLVAAQVPSLIAADAQATDSEPHNSAAADAATRLLSGFDPNSPESIARVPELIRLMQDDGTPHVLRQQLGMALGRIGKPAAAAVPILVRLLHETRTTSISTRPWALKSLGLFGDLAATAVPQLSRELSDRSRTRDDRVLVADVLGQIGTTAALQTLARELLRQQSDSADSEALLRQVIVDAIAQAGPQGVVALPALIRMTSDRNSDVRRKACHAIGMLGPQAELSLDPLLDRLVLDENAAVRDAAASSLAKIGPAAVPVLTRVMESGDPELQWRAARSLKAIGPRAASAVEVLQQTFDSQDGHVRIESLEAVWRIRRDAKLVAEPLVRELSSPDRQLRRHASRLLIEIDELPAAAMARLQALAADSKRDASRTAGYVLRELARRKR